MPPETLVLQELLPLRMGDCCAEFKQPWREWFTRLGNPAAWLTTGSDADYQEHVGYKTRYMVKKADRHFYYSRFVRNNFLAELDVVNASKAKRQGIPMTDAYVQPSKPTTELPHCEIHRRVWLGGFSVVDQSLAAYCEVITFENFAVLNKIIGHADHLSHGVMNGLVRFLNHYCHHHGLLWVNYLRMPSKTTGLEAFKRHSGFREQAWKLS